MNVEIDTMCQQHILMKQLTAAEDTTLLKITPKSKEDTTSNLQEETPLTSSQLQRKSPETLDAPSVWFSKRFFILILLFFGHIMMAVVGQVTNIAIIEMVSKNSHSTNDSNNFISQDVQGFSIASCATIFANWIPKPERSTCVSLVMNGFYIGNGLTFISCGYLMHRWGWSMAFYSTGTLCFIWSLLWLIFVPNDPADDKRISRRELLYIKKETGNVSPSNTGNPYKAILLTSSFWALTLCNFAYGWTNAFTVGYSPSFIKDAVQMDVNLVGYISSIPNLANIFTIPLAGILMSHWQKKSKLRDSQIHKIILCVGFLISSTLFTLIVIANNFVLSMICLVLINGMISYSRILCELIKVSMAPHHTSLISGMVLFGQTFGIIMVQNFVGYMVQNHIVKEWYVCFLWSSGILVFVASVYIIFGSSEPQSWSVNVPQEANVNLRNQNKQLLK
ncbi:vesicular glutamate transporter 2.2-like isoform X3 [Planococcus citri]|uniref:vesicular glutamate transporter 2.2-like isoform X3 n=1 Tax=Planococcus citri TaxID=170843 RepID=UPI0031F86127